MSHLETARSRGRMAVCALSLALMAAPAAAQDSTYTVLTSGTPLLGFRLGRVDQVHVDLSGRWIALAATDDTLATMPQRNQAWMDSTGVFQTEGDALAAPAGATLDGWGAVDTDDAGNLYQILTLTDGVGGVTGADDLGLYRNGVLILREGAGVAAAGVSGGTLFDNLLNFRVNGAGTELVVAAAIDDPAIPSPVDLALIRLTLNPTTGQILGQTVVAKEGDILPGQTRAVESLGTGYYQFTVNDAGSVMFVADLVGDEATDGVIYLDSTIIAQEGGTAFDPTRTWGVLTGHSVDLNDLGDYIFQATLAPSDSSSRVLATNGTIFKQSGFSVPGLPAFFRAKNFGPSNGPVRVDDAGHLFWYVETTATSGSRAIFYDDTLKVREGLNVAGAQTRFLHHGPGGWAVSDNNQILVYSATNTDNSRRVVILDTGPAAAATDAPQIAPAGLKPFLTGGPNPFTSSVEVRFAVPRDSDVRLEAFDVAGRKVADLATGPRAAGEYRVTWDGRNRDGRPVAPGVYFLRLRAADEDLQARVVRIQ